MQEFQFAAAALISFLWFCVHLFLGGKQVAAPLRASKELEPLVRDVQYLCWHFTSVAIAAMAIYFGMAWHLSEPAYAMAGTLLAAGFSVVGIGLVSAIRQSHAKAPQGWLFVPIASLGFWGIMSG